VAASTYWQDGARLAEISAGLGQPMSGLSVRTIDQAERFAPRGW
jgi:pyridoxal 5'-phosphate synthase pdxS subunit